MIVAGIVAVALVAIFVFIARRTFLGHEFFLTVFVDDSAGVAASSPVLLNGIPVGHVFRVSLSGSKDPARTVRIDMQFSRRYLTEIPDDSTAGITAANLLGDKYVNISRGIHPKHVEPGEELRATETQDIGSVLARGKTPLDEANRLFDRVDKILDYINSDHGTVGRLINEPTFQKRIDGITSAVQQIEHDYKNSNGAVMHIHDLVTEAHKPMTRLNDIMAGIDSGKGTLGRFLHDPYNPTLTAESKATIDEAKRLLDEAEHDHRPTDLMNRVQATSDRIGSLLDRVNSGQGTAGQFLINPQLRDSLHQAEAQMDSLSAAIRRHPTRFFAIRFGLF
jgi:phospholipid/cholesterol/gamma-HCH transport system substrate-binding protein